MGKRMIMERGRITNMEALQSLLASHSNQNLKHLDFFDIFPESIKKRPPFLARPVVLIIIEGFLTYV